MFTLTNFNHKKQRQFPYKICYFWFLPHHSVRETKFTLTGGYYKWPVVVAQLTPTSEDLGSDPVIQSLIFCFLKRRKQRKRGHLEGLIFTLQVDHRALQQKQIQKGHIGPIVKQIQLSFMNCFYKFHFQTEQLTPLTHTSLHL